MKFCHVSCHGKLGRKKVVAMSTCHPLCLDVLGMGQLGMVVVRLPGVEHLLAELALDG